LDPALTRPGRFDRTVHVSLPTLKERHEILDFYLTKHTCSPELDVKKIAMQTAGMSGADLENLVNWAAFEAVKRNRKFLDFELLESALLDVAMGREKKSMILSPAVKEMTAYHEGGHALVALYTKNAPEIRRATLMPRGQALGMVNYLPKDEVSRTKSELLGEITMAMGGRAAEELIYGSNGVTTGASGDFEQATQMAYAIVTKYGMNEKVGHVVIESKGNAKQYKGSPELIEQEVKKVLETAFQNAKSLLSQREDELRKLAQALLVHETLTKDEIEKLLRGESLE